MDIVIRLAKPDDARDMAEILSRSWEAAYRDIIPINYIKEKNATRHALFKRIITDENDRQYVIQADGKTIGVMCVAPPQEEADVQIVHDSGIDDSFYEVHGIYLHPDVYRQGIGKVAMHFAFDKARCAGKSHIILWVFAENTNAIKFYENCGFTPDGASKIYHCGKEMKCIRMRRKL
ncbi:MAG TPA: GNAT family N-acetyltransferase [Firmicutes bacterium]|nr:GNAT family N-acetyltransferase [Bacillota bacterium]